MTHTDTSPPLDKMQQTHLQQVLGTLLWYGHGVNSSILTALSTLALQQMHPTINTMTQLKQLLDFIASQDLAIITYPKSDMIYSIHGDAGYLNEANARSHEGRHHYLSDNQPFPPNNGAILTVSEISQQSYHLPPKQNLEHSMSMHAKEWKYATYYRNWVIINLLHLSKLTTALLKTSSTVVSNPTKAMDMQFHWLCDCSINHNQFRFFCQLGNTNLADYWTKHHPTNHHDNIRREFYTPLQQVLNL